VGSEVSCADMVFAEAQFLHTFVKTDFNSGRQGPTSGQGPTKYNKTIGNTGKNEFVYPIRAHFR
jgi:hypothetical protein